MALYRKTASDSIIRLDDGAFIPNEPANKDWLKYLQDVEGGAIVEEYVAPPTPQAQITKSVITARLIEAGKIDAAVAAIMSNPSAFARWVAPDKPVINADDPEAIAMISAIGADPDKILAVTE